MATNSVFYLLEVPFSLEFFHESLVEGRYKPIDDPELLARII